MTTTTTTTLLAGTGDSAYNSRAPFCPQTGLNSLETVVILLVLLAFALEAVVPVAVVAATLAAVAHVEAGVHLREGVHAQHLVDLTERQQPQRKLPKHRKDEEF